MNESINQSISFHVSKRRKQLGHNKILHNNENDNGVNVMMMRMVDWTRIGKEARKTEERLMLGNVVGRRVEKRHKKIRGVL
jgi:hypothetical protein